MFKKDQFRNIIEHKSGYTWSKEQESKYPSEGAIRVLTVTNVQDKLDLSSELYLNDVKEKDKDSKAVSKNWCIAVSSNGNRNRIGNAVFIANNMDFMFASFLTAFRPKADSDLDPKYFYYWLSSSTIQQRITAVSEGTTGLGNLDLRFLRNMDIEYPASAREQTAIATILSKVDEAIDATEQSIKAAEKLKRALMQNLLTGKLKPDGTWRKEDEFYEDEKFGKVPKGWEWKQIKSITKNVQYGLNKSASDNGIYPMFRMNNIIDGKMIDDPMVYVNLPIVEYEKYRLQKGDILFNRTNSMDLVGKVGIFDIEGDFVFASYLIRLQTDNNNNSYYLNYYLNSYSGQCSLRSKATPAVSQANINAKSLRNTYVPCPRLEEQQQIVDTINAVEDNKFNFRIKIQKLKKLKKALMQHLLTGKVRLSEELIVQLSNQEKEVVNG